MPRRTVGRNPADEKLAKHKEVRAKARKKAVENRRRKAKKEKAKKEKTKKAKAKRAKAKKEKAKKAAKRHRKRHRDDPSSSEPSSDEDSEASDSEETSESDKSTESSDPGSDEDRKQREKDAKHPIEMTLTSLKRKAHFRRVYGHTMVQERGDPTAQRHQGSTNLNAPVLHRVANPMALLDECIPASRDLEQACTDLQTDHGVVIQLVLGDLKNSPQGVATTDLSESIIGLFKAHVTILRLARERSEDDETETWYQAYHALQRLSEDWWYKMLEYQMHAKTKRTILREVFFDKLKTK